MMMIKKAALVQPSKRQLAWQEMEFYAFIHYTINTFTDREWGLGDEDPTLFNPTEFDSDQWVEVCKSAGMRGLILTCKHHDGFCLWPSAYTEHSIKSSPWREGKGDLVKEVAEACRRGGIKFGIYLSPWDRHEQCYGDSPSYNEFFKNQLRELLTSYGEIFCVWFDGACGEGPNGKRQVYDWEAYHEVIRELQPEAVISVCGPDVRWCGNEAGHCRDSEWSVVPAHLKENEKIQEQSQKVDDVQFSKQINTQDKDLGSREIIQHEDELIWYPAEVNMSIRPGWFYHKSEDDKVKGIGQLLEVYYGSVGGNANFLLNIPPDQRGLIHEKDTTRMKEFGQFIRETFKENLALNATALASSTMDEIHDVRNLFDGDRNTFWCPIEGIEQAVIEVDLQHEQIFDHLVLTEHIRSGQRIESFVLEYKKDELWIPFYYGTVVGFKRICRFEKISSKLIRLSIIASRWCPTISSLSIYLGK